MPLSQYCVPFNITGKSQLENIPHDSLATTEKVEKRERKEYTFFQTEKSTLLAKSCEFESTLCNLKRHKKVLFPFEKNPNQ